MVVEHLGYRPSADHERISQNRFAEDAKYPRHEPLYVRVDFAAYLLQISRSKAYQLIKEDVPVCELKPGIPRNEAELKQFIDKYVELKLRHRKMCRARMRGNHLVKREYRRLEEVLIPLIPRELHHCGNVLIKGFNDSGQHNQVFTEASYAKHQEAVRQSEHLQSISRDK